MFMPVNANSSEKVAHGSTANIFLIKSQEHLWIKKKFVCDV